MRIAVLSLAVGNTYKNIVEPSQLTKRNYCNMHGYDYVEDNSMHDKSRPIPWSKLLLIKKYINSYDYLVWMDADAMIMDNTQKIEDKLHLMKDKHMMVVSDWKQINSGVIFIKNTGEIVSSFIDRWYDQTEFINAEDWEQTALIHMYKNGLHGIHDILQVLDYTHEPLIQSYWFAYRPGHFILHLAGYRSLSNNRMIQLGEDLRMYCPARLPDDTDESYESRMKWLNGDVVQYVMKKMCGGLKS